MNWHGDPLIFHLITTLEDDDVIAAMVGGSVPDLDRGPLLDPLLPRLVGHHTVWSSLSRVAGVLIIWDRRNRQLAYFSN